MKNFGTLILLCFFCTTISAFAQKNKVTKPLSLEIGTEKSNFLKSEDIYVNVKVSNVGTTNITTNYPSLDAGFLKFILKDNEGKLYNSKNPKWHLVDTTVLEPKGYDGQSYDLIPSYGVGNIRIFPTTSFLPAGKYSLQATLQTGFGEITSNAIEFNVKEPEGKELDAYGIFEQAFYQAGMNNYNRGFQLFKELREKYPQSVYMLMTYRYELMIYKSFLQDSTKASEVAHYLVDNYPDTHYGYSGLIHLLNFGTNEKIGSEKRGEFLINVSNKYPNTKVGKFCNKILRKESIK